MNQSRLAGFLTVAIALLGSPVCGQIVTSTTLEIGVPGTFGCQNADDPPTLTGGVPASAIYEFEYDQSTRRLELTVTNTSAVTMGVPNPVITEIFFNLPDGAVTSATLVDQTGSGGAPPRFRLDLGARHANCFGDFDAELSGGRIANSNADTVVGGATVGPVTFVIELSGPGSETVDARSIALGFSLRAGQRPVNGAAKFQSGGPNKNESGVLGTGDDCAQSMFVIGEPRIGTVVQFCQSLRVACHDCLWISLDPGPTTIGPFTVPIGFPLLFVIDAGTFTSPVPVCSDLPIPGDRVLVGVPIYFVIATFPTDGSDPGTTNFSFGEQFVLTVRL